MSIAQSSMNAEGLDALRKMEKRGFSAPPASAPDPAPDDLPADIDGEKDAEYLAFVDKFKPKKTTDDCYTLPEIYECVRDYVCERWNISPDCIVRPFWPGADYQNAEYPAGCIVLDNPPFSIFAQIIRWYVARGIRFFLFAPALTMLKPCYNNKTVTGLNTGIAIVYENGASVNTGFVHNLDGGENVIETCSELGDRLKVIISRLRKQKKKAVRKLSHPVELVTSAKMNWLAVHHTDYAVKRRDCVMVSALDNDRKGVFGGGLLLTSDAAAEKAAAEKAAAEKIPLSAREIAIIELMERMRKNGKTEKSI